MNIILYDIIGWKENKISMFATQYRLNTAKALFLFVSFSNILL